MYTMVELISTKGVRVPALMGSTTTARTVCATGARDMMGVQGLITVLRALYRGRPEMISLEAWELQSCIWLMGYTDDLEDEDALVVAAIVARAMTDVAGTGSGAPNINQPPPMPLEPRGPIEALRDLRAMGGGMILKP